MNDRHPYAFSFGVVALTTVLGLVLRSYLAPIDLAMLVQFARLSVGTELHQPGAILTSVLSLAAFYFLFGPPDDTCAVHHAASLVTFGVKRLVTVVTTRLAALIRLQPVEGEAR